MAPARQGNFNTKARAGLPARAPASAAPCGATTFYQNEAVSETTPTALPVR